VSPEALLGGGYATILLVAALVLEWLSAHTHRHSLGFSTAGFEYRATHDVRVCREGEHLWPHEFDRERRLISYRARAHVCTVKDRCTDSDRGREIVRPLDPWPHSEAGRFHPDRSDARGPGRPRADRRARPNHAPAEAGALGALLVVCAVEGRFLLGDLRAHPASFPEPTPSHGLRMRGL
jgi:hypothetical protein